MSRFYYNYTDERGHAHLYVEDGGHETLWEVKYPEFYESNGEMIESNTIFDDGHMKHIEDIEGLASYLKSLGIFGDNDELIFEEHEDDETFADGGVSSMTIENKVKKRLSKAFDLPLEVSVYIPSTKEKDVIITKKELQERIDETEKFLSDTFGGYSAIEGEGGFTEKDKGLIQEGVVIVTTFSGKKNEEGVPFEELFEKLIAQVKVWQKKWSQASIGVEFEGDLFYVDDKTSFKNGGTIDEGNSEMIESNIHAIKHHAEEIQHILSSGVEVEAWVLAKAERAATDLSDITHYLDGLKAEKHFGKGGMADSGTFDEGVKAIEKKLEGTKVNPKYQKDYGKTYNKKEAHEAATNIKGAMRTKYGI